MNLNEICEVYSGYAFKEFHEDPTGNPVIKIGNITNNGSIDTANCSYTNEIVSDRYLSRDGDIYIALSGATTGKIGLMKENNYCINQRVGVVRLLNNNIPINYLCYFLQSKTKKILSDAAGAAQPNISPKDISRYQFPERKVNEMTTISNELLAIDNAIKVKKTELNNLNELIKSQFIEMFDNQGYPSKIGNELFKFSSGKFLDVKKRLEAGIPVYGGNGIAWYTDESLVNDDTIIIGRVGAYCGNARLVRGDKWITDNALYISKFKTNDFELEFLEQLMIQYDFHQYAGAAAQPKITQKPLDEQMYLIPPKSEQIKFTEFVKQIDKSKFIVQKQIDDLQELLDSKMQEYFGEEE